MTGFALMFSDAVLDALEIFVDHEILVGSCQIRVVK